MSSMQLIILLVNIFSEQDIPYLFLDILEASQNNAFIPNVKHLFGIMETYRKDAPILRRSFKILSDKLNGLNNCGTDQLELMSALKQFKMDFQHHEMYVAYFFINLLPKNSTEYD